MGVEREEEEVMVLSGWMERGEVDVRRAMAFEERN